MIYLKVKNGIFRNRSLLNISIVIYLKVKSGIVRRGSLQQYSMDITGPILPPIAVQLSSLLSKHVGAFSVHVTPLLSTLSFAHRLGGSIKPQTMSKVGGIIGM